MRPWAPDLRRSERGPTESDGSARPDATPGWLLAAHSAVCSRNASPIHHGDMGDSQMAPCTTVPSKAPRIPMVTFPGSQTHTCQMHLCYIMSPHYVVQEGISGDSSLAETCLREVRLRHRQLDVAKEGAWERSGRATHVTRSPYLSCPQAESSQHALPQRLSLYPEQGSDQSHQQ